MSVRPRALPLSPAFKHEQPSSGAAERRHADDGGAEAERARSWQELWGHYEGGGIMRRGLRGLGVAVGVGGVGGGVGEGVGEGNARPGSEDLGHRFAVAWVRVRAAFGDG